MMKCPICNTQFYAMNANKQRAEGGYNLSVAGLSGVLAEGESAWRQLNSQDTRARLMMAGAAGSMVMLETATIIANVQWPSWWWLVLHIGTPATLAIFVRLVWRFLELDDAVLAVKGKAGDTPDVPIQKKHKVSAAVQDSTGEGNRHHEGLVEFEVSSWKNLVTFFKSVVYADKNFSSAEAKRKDLTADDWSGIIDEFSRRGYVRRGTIGRGKTPELSRRGVAIVKAIADSPAT